MKKTAAIRKFKELSKTTARYATPLVVFFMWLYLFLGGMGLIHGFTNNPFKLRTFADWTLIVTWVLSGTVPLIWLLIKQKYHAWLTLVAVISVVMFVITLWPVFYQPNKVTAKTVTAMINHTEVTFWVAMTLLAVGTAVTLVLTRQSIRTSNWWVFIVVTPYSLLAFFTYMTWSGFENFVHAKNFDSVAVAKTLKVMKGQANLINNIQFTFMSLAIAGLIIFVGGVLSEFTWEKIKVKEKKARKDDFDET